MAPRAFLAAFLALIASGSPALERFPETTAVPSLLELQAIVASGATELFDGLSVSAAVLGSEGMEISSVPIMEEELSVARLGVSPGGAFEARVEALLDSIGDAVLALACAGGT